MMQPILRFLIAVTLVTLVAACRRHQSKGAADSGAAPRDSSSVATVATATSDDVEVFSAAQLAQVADALAAGPTTTRTVGVWPAMRFIEARRVSTGEPEVHDDWADVTMVQSGRATLVTGGRIEGMRATSAGEHRGGAIRGGKARVVRAGDAFVIPAGVPHQYEVARGDSIRYLTVKVARSAPAAGAVSPP